MIDDADIVQHLERAGGDRGALRDGGAARPAPGAAGVAHDGPAARRRDADHDRRRRGRTASGAMGLSAGAASCSAPPSPPPTRCWRATSAWARPARGTSRSPASPSPPRPGSTTAWPSPSCCSAWSSPAAASAPDIGRWIALDVVYAIAVGVVVGALGGRLIAAVATRLRERELVAVELDGWAALGAVLAIYGVTEIARRLRLPRRLRGRHRVPPPRARPRVQPRRARRRARRSSACSSWR